MLTRRKFLQTTAGAVAVLGSGSLGLSTGCGHHEAPREPLRMPGSFAGGSLVASAAGEVRMYGGTTPSPTIRLRTGDTLSVQLQNQLAEPTSIHWHGLITPANMDGHPKDEVAPGALFTYSFPVRQRAGTYWYHPHPHMISGRQIYSGMAGFFLVEDAEEQALPLPRGEFDLPLLIQDRRMRDGTIAPYEPADPDVANGFLGETIFVNGTPSPYIEVAAGLYRLRLLNGSNARIYRLVFDDMRNFHVIATDGGLLDAPVQTSSLWLGPAERAEILVDFSPDGIGKSVMLMSMAFGSMAPSGGHAGHGGGTSSVPPNGSEMEILRFDVKREAAAKLAVPTKLATLTRLDPAQAARTRPFELAMREGATSGMHTINGKLFELSRVDEQVRSGDTEIWEFKSLDEAAIHPMHLHGAQFQVLSRSSGPLNPNDLGWKDTVLVFPMETVRVIVRFGDYRGIYLVHCHTLEHEDDGMMLNYEIV